MIYLKPLGHIPTAAFPTWEKANRYAIELAKRDSLSFGIFKFFLYETKGHYFDEAFNQKEFTV